MNLSNSTAHTDKPTSQSIVTPYHEVLSETLFDSPQTDSSPTPASDPASPAGEPVPLSELERLREILYGRKTRVTDDRLSTLENQVRVLEEQFYSRLVEETSNLRTFFLNEMDTLHRQLTTRLDQQAAQFDKALGTLQREFADQLETQETNQTDQWRATKKGFTDKVEDLAAHSETQLRAVQTELNDRFQAFSLDQGEKLRHLQAETRKRDEGLRTEWLEASGTLRSQKVGRREMIQLFVELAHRLQSED